MPQKAVRVLIKDSVERRCRVKKQTSDECLEMLNNCVEALTRYRDCYVFHGDADYHSIEDVLVGIGKLNDARESFVKSLAPVNGWILTHSKAYTRDIPINEPAKLMPMAKTTRKPTNCKNKY